MFDIAELIGDLIQGPSSPTLARRLSLFEERVTALDDPARDDSVKRRAVVEAGTGELYELLRVLESFVGEELKPNHTEIGGDDGFQLSGFFERDIRLRGLR